MVRLLFRFVGYWLVAAALVAAVVDGAKSIAASSPVLTSLAQSWGALSHSGAAAGGSPKFAVPWPLELALNWILQAPTVAVLALLGFALLAVTARRRMPGQEFAY